MNNLYKTAKMWYMYTWEGNSHNVS